MILMVPMRKLSSREISNQDHLVTEFMYVHKH